jgi:hypothetical protein
LPFVDRGKEVGEALEIKLLNLAKQPFVDPLRDLAAPDSSEWLPLSPELDGEWAGLFTPWENTDAYLGGTRPGAAWLARRRLPAIATGIRLWWELRGWRDTGDPERYRGQWNESIPITAYLGWPAYLIAAAVETVLCENCGRVTIQGRRFCGGRECDRARAVARKRLGRSAALRHVDIEPNG